MAKPVSDALRVGMSEFVRLRCLLCSSTSKPVAPSSTAVGLHLRLRAANIPSPRAAAIRTALVNPSGTVFFSTWKAWKKRMEFPSENRCFQVWRTSKKVQRIESCDCAEGRLIKR